MCSVHVIFVIMKATSFVQIEYYYCTDYVPYPMKYNYLAAMQKYAN